MNGPQIDQSFCSEVRIIILIKMWVKLLSNLLLKKKKKNLQTNVVIIDLCHFKIIVSYKWMFNFFFPIIDDTSLLY